MIKCITLPEVVRTTRWNPNHPQARPGQIRLITPPHSTVPKSYSPSANCTRIQDKISSRHAPTPPDWRFYLNVAACPSPPIEPVLQLSSPCQRLLKSHNIPNPPPMIAHVCGSGVMMLNITLFNVEDCPCPKSAMKNVQSPFTGNAP